MGYSDYRRWQRDVDEFENNIRNYITKEEKISFVANLCKKEASIDYHMLREIHNPNCLDSCFDYGYFDFYFSESFIKCLDKLGILEGVYILLKKRAHKKEKKRVIKRTKKYKKEMFRMCAHMKYKPTGHGFLEAKKNFESLVLKNFKN